MPRSRSKQYQAWTTIAVFIIVAGSLGSWFGATEVAHSADQKSHKAFITTSNEIAANLKLSIQHEQDLINSTESFLLGNANTSQAQFTAWANNIHVLSNYPELVGLGVIKIVPASQLSAYAHQASLTQSVPFQIVPAGRRSFYCLAPFGFFRTKKVILPKDIDLCATSLRGALLKSRDTGESEVLPFSEFGLHTMGLETPLYRGAIVPVTAASRRSSFAEFVGLILKPSILLQRAREGHMNMAIAFQYGGTKSQEIFRSGVVDAHAQISTVNLHDGWTLKTFDAIQSGGLLGDGDALALLFAGIALNLLLGALIFALGTGRARSMMLVEERTNELLHQAMHDALTGLPNRALIVDRIEHLLERNRRSGTLGAALYIDLDDFKNVNDTLGHEAGDRLLIAVAERMKNTLRGADTIGRMGGDEFVVLIDGAGEIASPQMVAERLLNVMRQPFTICGSDAPLVVTISIGIALGDRVSGVEFLRDADVALYQAKAAGKNQYMLFNAKMQNDINRRLTLEFDLRSALVGEQFFLLYQPIYNLEDLSIVGVEALLRWRHPLQGVIQPDEFIPILEKNGQIREVGAWVLREACTQMSVWHERGHIINISVNVSARQLDSDLIIDHIREALLVSELGVNSLVIEVTETALMLDVEMSIMRLQAIKDLGVSIAIDDFGTGYCSLSYLRQFPIDCIKIDKSFTRAITTSTESQALVKTFIQLGKDLGLKTLAEGVETIGQMDLLRSSNVVEVQGFLFSHPLEPELLEAQILEPMRFSGTNNPPKSK